MTLSASGMRPVSGAMLAFMKPDCINTHISASLLVNIGSLVHNYSFVVIVKYAMYYSCVIVKFNVL